MSDLISRLQKADTPDRALDWEIHCRKSLDGVGAYGDHPAYTASMDAALRLVPREYDWIVGDVNGQVGGTPYACVGDENPHYGATAIISLCLAALRAERAQH